MLPSSNHSVDILSICREICKGTVLLYILSDRAVAHLRTDLVDGQNLGLLQEIFDALSFLFVIETYEDGRGRYFLLCYGFGWKGTYAAGKYFHTEVFPNLSSFPYPWVIVKWEDANGDWFVNTGADGDVYTLVAMGP